jgi:hypothetical protein
VGLSFHDFATLHNRRWFLSAVGGVFEPMTSYIEASCLGRILASASFVYYRGSRSHFCTLVGRSMVWLLIMIVLTFAMGGDDWLICGAFPLNKWSCRSDEHQKGRRGVAK